MWKCCLKAQGVHESLLPSDEPKMKRDTVSIHFASLDDIVGKQKLVQITKMFYQLQKSCVAKVENPNAVFDRSIIQ